VGGGVCRHSMRRLAGGGESGRARVGDDASGWVVCVGGAQAQAKRGGGRWEERRLAAGPDCGRAGRLCIVTEFMDCGSLHDVLQAPRDGAIANGANRRLEEPLAGALLAQARSYRYSSSSSYNTRTQSCCTHLICLEQG